MNLMGLWISAHRPQTDLEIPRRLITDKNRKQERARERESKFCAILQPAESPAALRLVDEFKSSRSGPKGLKVERSDIFNPPWPYMTDDFTF